MAIGLVNESAEKRGPVGVLDGPFGWRARFVMLTDNVTYHINTSADRNTTRIVITRRALLINPSD